MLSEQNCPNKGTALNIIVQMVNHTEQAIRDLGALARNAGITTCTDLAGASILSPKALSMWQQVTNDEHYPLRVAQYNIPAMPGAAAAFHEVADQFVELQKKQTEKLIAEFCITSTFILKS